MLVHDRSYITRMSASGTTWLWSQGFYIQTMSCRALFPAALGGGFRTWLIPHIAPSHPDPLLQEGAPGKPLCPGPQTQTTDHGCPWACDSRPSAFWGGSRVARGAPAPQATTMGGGATPQHPALPARPHRSKTRWENETRRQAQKDIKPTIYTKYYSF